MSTEGGGDCGSGSQHDGDTHVQKKMKMKRERCESDSGGAAGGAAGSRDQAVVPQLRCGDEDEDEHACNPVVGTDELFAFLLYADSELGGSVLDYCWIGELALRGTVTPMVMRFGWRQGLLRVYCGNDTAPPLVEWLAHLREAFVELQRSIGSYYKVKMGTQGGVPCIVVQDVFSGRKAACLVNAVRRAFVENDSVD